ncbi:outer membrane protein assembly factor BamD [Candidatus Kinetoplastidibacterium crithidiae]|uniref:Putative lipoprotein n=1 Tax=Candidatus Kinetoplastidibacterium crithidiae TCC036E TaxID=1208918 RepID=M1LWZ1_9PROT|nr:outer membrane protein assembly factor BamD [Candidatus Kinetoplastibacterium crithidii]AFZ82620.1 lipoprotein [Candidatus Kinetoplastibacterium crithidii (ex Angomonas deanei ATCC 30255)]AGF47719.1 putative lipoprotein [Candidatus Kinetoplastibacterium crithidii TCC036E]
MPYIFLKKLNRLIIYTILLLNIIISVDVYAYNNATCINNNIYLEDEFNRELYLQTIREIENKHWIKSKELIHKIIVIRPFGEIYKQSLINLIYVKWQNGEIEEALTDIEQFQKKYPGANNMDYILYMKGLINFSPKESFISFFNKDIFLEKDVKKMQNAYKIYDELIQNFPNSKYIEEAKKLLNFTKNSIAKNELNIAEYYFNKEAYLASINRANNIIENFKESPYSCKAKQILEKSYKELNMNINICTNK